MIKQYIKQSIQMLKENRLVSVISIAGTAISIAMIMVVVLVFQIQFANFYPENNRDRMMYVDVYKRQELLDIENTTFGVQLAILDGKTLKIVELTQIYTWKSTTWKVSEQEVPTVIMDAFKASEYGNDQVESIYMFTDANGAFHKFNVIHNGQAVTVEFDVFGNIVTNK